MLRFARPSADRLSQSHRCQGLPFLGIGLALAMAVGGAMAVPGAKAACLTTVAENNCATFNSSSTSTAVQAFTSLNLSTNRYFQLSLLTNAGVSYTITDLAWSKDGSSFTNFSPLSLNLNSDGSRVYTNIVDYGSAIGVPLYLRYTIPTGVALGAIIEGTLIANDNGSNGGGVLTDSINNYQAVNRQSLSVAASAAVPAPVPILGAAGFFVYSRQLRRRLRF